MYRQCGIFGLARSSMLLRVQPSRDVRAHTLARMTPSHRPRTVQDLLPSADSRTKKEQNKEWQTYEWNQVRNQTNDGLDGIWRCDFAVFQLPVESKILEP